MEGVRRGQERTGQPSSGDAKGFDVPFDSRERLINDRLVGADASCLERCRPAALGATPSKDWPPG